MWEDAVRSQKENSPPKRGEFKRFYLFETPEALRQLKKERLAYLAKQGFCECYVADIGKVTLPIADCVTFPNGKHYPKIEYLMDKLGAKEVTQMLRDRGFDWRRSDSLQEYKKWRDNLVLELVTNNGRIKQSKEGEETLL